jgi:hypothetical protein
LRATSRWFAIAALLLANAYWVPAAAADVMLTVAISPDVAYQVREWRRAHGLPQAPEAAPPHAVSDGRGAIEQALQLIGIEDQSRNELRVSVVRVGAHWQVTIESQGDDPDYVVDVADAIAKRSAF